MVIREVEQTLVVLGLELEIWYGDGDEDA